MIPRRGGPGVNLPHACGVYILRDAASRILYIGKAKDLAKRVAHYFRPDQKSVKTAALSPLVRAVDYAPCASEREALLLERRLIKSEKPFFNIALKDDKAYPYVKITLGEDFPRALLTRRKIPDGSAYFGPFPKASQARSLLRFLWGGRLGAVKGARHGRPDALRLRPCRWTFGFERPLDPKKINSCLYYHTSDCPAPCAGLISYESYRSRARGVELFFRGQRSALEKSLEKRMKSASGALDYEQAALIRDQLSALAQIAERVKLRAVTAEDLVGTLHDSRSVTELQKALGLGRPPFHIECFDISHFQGRQTVASMSCFVGGKPNKGHYRRFRIRKTAGIDDFKSMAEAVGRRCRRLKREGRPLPDLILVDGGKGQLGAALKAVKNARTRIPLAALAKRFEEVFVPGLAGPLRLERGSPARNLLERLRDEAHRFGVRYHRLLRGQGLFGWKKERSSFSQKTRGAVENARVASSLER